LKPEICSERTNRFQLPALSYQVSLIADD